nr:structural protein [Tolivirales sp. gcode 6]
MKNSNKNKNAKAKNNVAPVNTFRRAQNSGATLSGTDQRCLVKHTEMVRFFTASANVNTVQIFRATANPGNGLDFPWLSQIATRFEKYKFKKLAYRIVSYLPTTSAGNMGMYFDYDPVDTYPTNESEFFSNYKAQVSSAWGNMVCEVKPPTAEFFVRGEGENGQAAKWYDTGALFYFLRSNVAGNAAIFVDYEIELMRPQGVRRLRATNGIATWTEMIGERFPNVPPQINTGLLVDSNGRISVPEVGWYRATVVTNSTTNGDFITNVLGNSVQGTPIINDTDFFPLTTQVFTIYKGPSQINVFEDAFTLNDGDINTSGYLSGGPSPVSIELEFIRNAEEQVQ